MISNHHYLIYADIVFYHEKASLSIARNCEALKEMPLHNIIVS